MEQYDWAADLGTHALRINGTKVEFYAVWATCAPCREAKGGEIKPNQWTHVVVTYDLTGSSGKLSLFQNGVFDVSQTITDPERSDQNYRD